MIEETTVDIAGREVKIRYTVEHGELLMIELLKTFGNGVLGVPFWEKATHQLFELLAPYCWSHWSNNKENAKYDY